MKIMASGPITSWQRDQTNGKTITVTDFNFLGSKVTVDDDCSHEIKRCLLLGRKAIINLDSMLKSRDITLLTKVHLVKGMVFPVVMHGCESWTVKKAECWRIDAFELQCWRRVLRIPWTARRSNQSILKEIKYSLEGLMLKLKLQYFGHLMRPADWLEKTLMLGKIEGWRRRGDWGWDGWTGSLTQWTWVWANSGRWWRTGKPGVPQSTGLQRVQYYWATEQQQLINVDELKKLSHSTGELSGDAEAVQQWRKKKDWMQKKNKKRTRCNSWGLYFWGGITVFFKRQTYV